MFTLNELLQLKEILTECEPHPNDYEDDFEQIMDRFGAVVDTVNREINALSSEA